jgi:hypothetical protein
MTNDTINSIGSTWLSQDELARVRELSGKRMLYVGQHKHYFVQQDRTQHDFPPTGPRIGLGAKVLYIAENLPGRCSLKFADLLFGEELAVEPAGSANGNADAAAAIARFRDASSLDPLLYESAATASWAGKAHVQLLVRAGQVVAENVQPENIFPIYAPGTDRLVSATIKFQVELKGQSYVRVIEHTIGKITHRLDVLDSTGKISASGVGAGNLDLIEPGLAENPVQETRINELTVVELENFTTGGRGISDYEGNDSLIDEVNNRRSQISRVLDVHGDPAVMVLAGLFDKDGNFQMKGRSIVVEDTTKGDAVKYVTWEARLEEAAKALVDATNAYCGQMEIAPALLGLGGGTSADSWKKFKLQVSQTLARVKRKRTFISSGIKTIFRVAMLLENAWTPRSYAVVPVNLTFSDGLPTDDSELATTIEGLYGAGLMSREMALTWLHGDKSIVAVEMERLAGEDEAKLPTAFRGGAAGLADDPTDDAGDEPASDQPSGRDMEIAPSGDPTPAAPNAPG